MNNPLTRLRQFIADHYDIEELRTFCFDLDVNYGALPGEGTAAKARELVLLLRRRERLDALLVELRQGRSEAFDEAGLGRVTVEALYDALPAWEESTAPPVQRTLDARGAQTGVVGDHAHIEGGIHFHAPPTSPADLRNRQARQRRALMLQLVHNFWIQGVLEQSLHGAAMLELGIRRSLTCRLFGNTV